jgi:hypothetical protein
VESQETHLDLRQQKHQQDEIENGESDQKPVKFHGLLPSSSSSTRRCFIRP